jgi:hypothetical protein
MNTKCDNDVFSNYKLPVAFVGFLKKDKMEDMLKLDAIISHFSLTNLVEML